MSTDDRRKSQSPAAHTRKSRRAVTLPDGRIVQPSGGWVRPFQKGVTQPAKSRADVIREIRRMGKAKSVDLMKRLIDIALTDPDTRVAAVAIREAFLWTYGKPEDLKPDDGTGERPLDASKLTDRELAVLAKLVDSNRLTPAPEPSDEPAEIDGMAQVVASKPDGESA